MTEPIPPCTKPKHDWRVLDRDESGGSKTDASWCINCGLRRNHLVWFDNSGKYIDEISSMALDFHRKQKTKYEHEIRKATGNANLRITDELIRTFLMLGHSRDVIRDIERDINVHSGSRFRRGKTYRPSGTPCSQRRRNASRPTLSGSSCTTRSALIQGHMSALSLDFAVAAQHAARFPVVLATPRARSLVVTFAAYVELAAVAKLVPAFRA